MTVRDLIETLENYPLEMPVVSNGCEISEVLIRDELYLTEDHDYKEGQILKLY